MVNDHVSYILSTHKFLFKKDTVSSIAKQLLFQDNSFHYSSTNWRKACYCYVTVKERVTISHVYRWNKTLSYPSSTLTDQFINSFAAGELFTHNHACRTMWKISSIFSRNSEASASELRESNEEIFLSLANSWITLIKIKELFFKVCFQKWNN